MTVLEVRRARDQAELDAAIALRTEVFIHEQGVTPAGERDGRDPEALHLVAVDGDGMVVGACRLLVGDPPRAAPARFGRLCVRADRRRAGVGAALLAEAEREARAAGAARMELHAQTSALDLYRNAGYVEDGEVFLDEGIEHLAMEKAL